MIFFKISYISHYIDRIFFIKGDKKKKTEKKKESIFLCLTHKPMVTLNMTTHLNDLWLLR